MNPTLFTRLLGSIFLGFICQSVHAVPAFKINNMTSFFLISKTSAIGCPKQIAPGESATSSEYWCGYLACATKDYDEQRGCLEKNNTKTSLTEGGYATWFSISFGTGICTVPEANAYQCQYAKNGDLTFDYRSSTQVYSAGPFKDQVVALPKTIAKYNSGPAWRGINISGLEYDGTYLDALYQHPDLPDIRYFAEQGMNIVRLPIRWEFIVSDSANGVNSKNPLSPIMNNIYLAAVYDTVEKYLKSGVAVDLDLHNYMRFCATGADVGQANEPTDLDNSQCQLVTDKLASIWEKLLTTKIKRQINGTVSEVSFASLAQQYPDLLILELMNEPYSDQNHPNQQLKTEDVFKAELTAVRKIRSYGIKNLILLSGNYWDPLHGWATESPVSDDKPNGVVFSQVFTPEVRNEIGDIAIDMHQYFDFNFSGVHEQCQTFASYNEFKQKLALDDVANWIHHNGMKVFLGEFGAADNEACRTDLNYMLQYVNENAYVPNQGGFIGWTVWRANRHGNTGFSNFNYLQKEDFTVYGAQGSKDKSPEGTGILQGPGNGLMDVVFSKHLKLE